MTTPLFERDAVLDNLDGDVELLHEIAGIYLESYSGEIERINTATASKDGAGLYTIAHTLKGSVGNFGATALVEAARVVELHARQNQFDNVAAEVARLTGLLEQLAAELRAEVGSRAA